MIEIWQPRWHDRKALIAKYKVTPGVNRIVFTKCKALRGMVFDVDGVVLSRCPVESNGSIDCYAVPLDTILGDKKDLTA